MKDSDSVYCLYCITNDPRLNGLNQHTFIILPFPWVRNLGIALLGCLLQGLSLAVIKEAARGRISSEGLAGEGSTSKPIRLLAGFGSYSALLE